MRERDSDMIVLLETDPFKLMGPDLVRAPKPVKTPVDLLGGARIASIGERPETLA